MRPHNASIKCSIYLPTFRCAFPIGMFAAQGKTEKKTKSTTHKWQFSTSSIRKLVRPASQKHPAYCAGEKTHCHVEGNAACSCFFLLYPSRLLHSFHTERKHFISTVACVVCVFHQCVSNEVVAKMSFLSQFVRATEVSFPRVFFSPFHCFFCFFPLVILSASLRRVHTVS